MTRVTTRRYRSPMTLRGTESSNSKKSVKLVLICAVMFLLAAWTFGGTNPRSGDAPKAHSGGVATFSMTPGTSFTWIFPILNVASYEAWNQNAELGLYRPLYWAGTGSSMAISSPLSFAFPPVWSHHDTEVSIRLKNYKWSDGDPITTADIKFFFELLDANKTQDALYVPGDMPDNIKSISYPNKSDFMIHLRTSVNPAWFEGNQLTNVFPFPVQEWDRTSLKQSVGNYAATPSGAKAVFKFLSQQSSKLSTYATNPLWKVVDGPWRLTSYSAATGDTTFSRNIHYVGADKPHLDQYKLLDYTSNTAEIDALRTGAIDYGWLPYNSYEGLAGYFRSHGYTVAPWHAAYLNWGEFGYTNPTYGPLVRQLYIRQALLHLVNEHLLLNAALHGIGQLVYGPVPDLPGPPYVTHEELTDPDPYSPRAALRLLNAHGWKNKGGALVCERPGTGSNQCGAKIAKGRKFVLSFVYPTATYLIAPQAQQFATTAESVGVKIQLEPEPLGTVLSQGGVCPPGPCNYGILAYDTYIWNYGAAYQYPSGGGIFGPKNYWGGGYSSPVADRLINATDTKIGLQYLHQYENYISRQVAGLWLPSPAYQISVVKKTLRGWAPQQVFGDEMPERWYFSS